jgi:hypothetical protein
MSLAGANVRYLDTCISTRYTHDSQLPPQGKNKNWRLTFAFDGRDAILVDYVDYH